MMQQGETTVTTTTVYQSSGPGVHINPAYFRSVPFIVRILHIVLAIIVLICIGASFWSYRGIGFVYFTAIVSLITAIVYELIYVLGLHNSMFSKVQWLLVLAELVDVSIWSLFYFISGCICIAAAVYYNKSNHYSKRSHESYAAASFFCWLAALVYGVHIFVIFREGFDLIRQWWNSRKPTGPTHHHPTAVHHP